MSLDVARMRQHLKEFDFRRLFTQELGWDRPESKTLTVTVEGRHWPLDAIAHKRGMIAFHCPSPDGEAPPPHALRRKIEHQVAKAVHEHLVIFTDAGQTTQTWLWVKRETGRPTACRQHTYNRGQPGDGLIQKLQALKVTLEEEEQLTIVEAVAKAKAAFDVDKVTKRFYDRFQKEHQAFLDFLKGIPDDDMQRWYVSVMLNRLMFIYFIQSKGFLGGADRNYLRTKLVESKLRGRDRYYREFLCPLFFEGFAKRPQERSAAMNELLGAVPYLNGGLFLRHQIEELHGAAIRIPDAAFEKLFDFFQGYHWHLDERPLRADNEINPDVLGYIFEKYINQKQMGAYYTKEDITEYIAKNTIIPFLFDAAARKCPDDFAADAPLWRLLREDPDRYLYEAVRRGVVDDAGNVLPESALPDFVRKGMHDPKTRMFDRRYNLAAADLHAATGEKLTLPTETWREYAVRRQRCLELCEKLGKGEVHSVNDLITLNLDIRQFAQDAIADCQSPELLAALFDSIRALTVLDPTCGSGAFLFAALNVLEPLYEACLDRMEALVNEDCSAGVPPATKGKEQPARPHAKNHFLDAFRAILQSVNEDHPNAKYYIFKSIIIQNLFGVDIMEEATEICKLRLFLKLVAQVDPDPEKPNLGVEPLPDIDFNIRAGNTLVGYATIDEIRRAQAGKLAFGAAEIARLETQATAVAGRFDAFRRMQGNRAGSECTPADLTAAKQTLRTLQAELAGELDRYLAGEYGIDADHPKKAKDFQKWRQTHQPFHWFVEFHGIMHNGGFDVIIGNPPYVEYSKVRGDYQLNHFATEPCGNLYAFCIERSYAILGIGARFGFIVQAPIVSTQRMTHVRTVLRHRSDRLWYSTFDDRPSKLFDGMHHARLSVILSRVSSETAKPSVATTRYHKWYREERPLVFANLNYLLLPDASVQDIIPKFRSVTELSAFAKIEKAPERLGSLIDDIESSYCIFYKITGVGHWFAFTLAPPKFSRDGVEGSSTRENRAAFRTKILRDTAFCALCSTLHYWLYQIRTNCRDFNPSDLAYLPLPAHVAEGMPQFGPLASRIQACLEENSSTASGTYSIGGKVSYQKYHPKSTKPLLDEVDGLLAAHFGLTDAELDFIINYDIKYRMGQDSADGDDE